MKLYRAACWLYPPSFRREFSADLDQTYRDFRREHGGFTTFRRTLADLLWSVPTQHLEAVMSRTSSAVVNLTSMAVLVAAVGAAVVFGRPALAVIPLIVAIGAVLVYRHSEMPYRDAARDSSRLWLRFLVAGVGLFAVLIVAAGVHENWNWFPWELLILLVLVGWALIATGVVLGVVNAVHRLSHRPAS